MKIGIFSDLHLEFTLWNEEPWDFVEDPLVDVYINAGDTDTTRSKRSAFYQKHPRVLTILGNHDFWYQKPGPFEVTPVYSNIGGVVVAGVTLWTDIPSDQHWEIHKRFMLDYRKMHPWIPNLNRDIMLDWHYSQKKFLMQSGADVIFTHHLPSYRSVHPRYAGNGLNFAFATELEEDILNMAHPPKLWVHGHTHDPCDYMIGETRVICHPRGYPQENPRWNEYQPMIVEI
jgi:predicted phosphodiesterase